MFISKKDEYVKPQIMIVKFGSEDIITSSPDNDPWVDDPFDD